MAINVGDCRALALKPQILLLDEPAAGMNPNEKHQFSAYPRIRTQFNLTVILIEHHVPLVMGLCDRVAVLDFGQLLALGRPAEVRTNPAVIEAYLGQVMNLADQGVDVKLADSTRLLELESVRQLRWHPSPTKC